MEAIVYKNNIKLLICGQSKLQGGEPMDGWMDGWTDGWMDRSINALTDGWIDKCIDLWIDRSMDRSING